MLTGSKFKDGTRWLAKTLKYCSSTQSAVFRLKIVTILRKRIFNQRGKREETSQKRFILSSKVANLQNVGKFKCFLNF
jgi:hypothetical protein